MDRFTFVPALDGVTVTGKNSLIYKGKERDWTGAVVCCEPHYLARGQNVNVQTTADNRRLIHVKEQNGNYRWINTATFSGSFGSIEKYDNFGKAAVTTTTPATLKPVTAKAAKAASAPKAKAAPAAKAAKAAIVQYILTCPSFTEAQRVIELSKIALA